MLIQGVVAWEKAAGSPSGLLITPMPPDPGENGRQGEPKPRFHAVTTSGHDRGCLRPSGAEAFPPIGFRKTLTKGGVVVKVGDAGADALGKKQPATTWAFLRGV